MARRVALGLLVLIAGAATLAVHTWLDIHADDGRERVMWIAGKDVDAPPEAGMRPACANRVEVYGCRRSEKRRSEASATVGLLPQGAPDDASHDGSASIGRTAR